MEHQQTRQLENDTIGKLLVKFSVPAVIGTFFNSLYNVVDRIFIGQGVGPDGLAAAMIAFPLVVIIMAFGMLIAFGSNALISIRLGEKKKDEAEKILGQALVLLGGFAILFTAFGLLFLTPLLKLFGASASVLPLAQDYMRIILFGTLAHEISFGVNNFIRAEGNPRIAMLTMLLGAGTNIVLDPIFIFGLHLGMKGAAWATVIARSLAAAWVLWYYFSGRSVLKIRKEYLRAKWDLVKRVMGIGSPPFAMNIANVFILAIVNNSLKHFGGDIAISVMGVIFTINMLNLMPVIGVSQGAQPIIGYNFGAQRPDRVRDTLNFAIRIVTIFCTAATLLIMLFPKYTFLPFSRGEGELVALGTNAIRLVMAMFPFTGFLVIVSNYFQATARPKLSLFLSMMRQVLAFIPVVLILPHFVGLYGVWAAYPLSAAFSLIFASVLYARERKKLKVAMASMA